MKYTGIVVDFVSRERSLIQYSNNLDEVRRWAKLMLEKYPEAQVDIYELKLDLLETIKVQQTAPQATSQPS